LFAQESERLRPPLFCDGPILFDDKAHADTEVLTRLPLMGMNKPQWWQTANGSQPLERVVRVVEEGEDDGVTPNERRLLRLGLGGAEADLGIEETLMARFASSGLPSDAVLQAR
jgi:hypothetical protein